MRTGCTRPTPPPAPASLPGAALSTAFRWRPALGRVALACMAPVWIVPYRTARRRAVLWVAVLCFALLPAATAVGAGEGQVALEYYRALAEGGSADAQLALGDLYANGDGMPQDLVEAYAWYYLAAQQGLEEAIQPMNQVLRALPRDRWALARERAEAYERRIVQRRP